jgi:hypothetical protein
MRRALTWVVLLPFAATSVLIGHVVAYRVTGAPADGLHGYLGHAPQVVLILATLALLGLAADARARRSSPLPLALLAIGAFVAQEHLERLIHTGEVPFLLTSPVLWIGIALQLPLTLAVWWFARRVACDLAASPRRAAPRLGALTLAGAAPAGRPLAFRLATAASGRGPPVLS